MKDVIVVVGSRQIGPHRRRFGVPELLLPVGELVSAGTSQADVQRPVALLSSRGARAASAPPL
jgi:hypothetical protein